MAEPVTPALAIGQRRGLIFILSSPSGAGKSTLSRLLLEREDGNVALSVSVTTRPRRGSEVDGVHYHFKTQKEFDRLRDNGDLLEWAEVHGNCYGTPREPVENALAQGKDILFDIDWQGTQQVRDMMIDDVVTVFILPPSLKELKSRLERRAEDAPETIAKRLKNALIEMQHWQEYDYLLVNDDLDRTYHDLEDILKAERLKRPRRPKLEDFVQTLFSEAKELGI
jgi:guanylate kinase